MIHGRSSCKHVCFAFIARPIPMSLRKTKRDTAGQSEQADRNTAVIAVSQYVEKEFHKHPPKD